MGTKALNDGKFQGAIAYYSQALNLSRLSSSDKSVSFSFFLCLIIDDLIEQIYYFPIEHMHTFNKVPKDYSSFAHPNIILAQESKMEKQNLLQPAYTDAKMAKRLLPTWFRPYVRIGKILVRNCGHFIFSCEINCVRSICRENSTNLLQNMTVHLHFLLGMKK